MLANKPNQAVTRSTGHGTSRRDRQTVVLVPGLWTPASFLWPLQQRLQRAGFLVHRFRVSSRRESPDTNARRLALFLSTLDGPVIHLIGHSLGGVILLHLFEQGYRPASRFACTLLLATPVNGSSLAARLVQGRYGRIWRYLLGQSIERGLLGDVPQWRSSTDVTSIAGKRSAGLASLLFPRKGTGDGVLLQEETRLPVPAGWQCIDVSHAGFLWSGTAAAASIAYLRGHSQRAT